MQVLSTGSRIRIRFPTRLRNSAVEILIAGGVSPQLERKKHSTEQCVKRFYGVCLALAITALVVTKASAQKGSGEPEKPMVLTETIPLENVKGRYDGAATGGGRLFLAARGNNTLEVIDLGARTQLRSIHVPDPTGVAFSPETRKIFVASGRQGKVYIYDAGSYELVDAVDFGGDADGMQYDRATKRVYVAFGDGEKAGIGIIDAMTNQRLDGYVLGSHPEQFELEKSGPNIYVNLPESKEVAAINRTTKAVARWHIDETLNLPMALDEVNHRLFIATQGRPRLLVLDTNSGRVIANLPCVQGASDLFYDEKRKRVYVPGMEGYISVFQQTEPDQYRLLTKVPSEIGIRGSVYPPVAGKGFDRLYVAVPFAANRSGEILIYTVQD